MLWGILGVGAYSVCSAPPQGLTFSRTRTTELLRDPFYWPLWCWSRLGAGRQLSLVSETLLVVGLTHLAELSLSSSDKLLFCVAALCASFLCSLILWNATAVDFT